VNINLLTDKEKCRADCPGHNPYRARGTLIKCDHGVYFMVIAPYVSWFSDRWEFRRISKFWDPSLYRRARLADEQEQVTEGGTP